jgi:hypothetical protein
MNDHQKLVKLLLIALVLGLAVAALFAIEHRL